MQVVGLTEFAGIDNNGNQEERQRTYSQSTTTGTQNWYWTEESFDVEFALMMVDVSIPKFEYTSIVVNEQTKQGRGPIFLCCGVVMILQPTRCIFSGVH